uniref:Uncharacterized protein n=1 Tax=Anguilla anguilla TaxID=7936 RepID=A0A0E9QF55_ANGAN
MTSTKQSLKSTTQATFNIESAEDSRCQNTSCSGAALTLPRVLPQSPRDQSPIGPALPAVTIPLLQFCRTKSNTTAYLTLQWSTVQQPLFQIYLCAVYILKD